MKNNSRTMSKGLLVMTHTPFQCTRGFGPDNMILSNEHPKNKKKISGSIPYGTGRKEVIMPREKEDYRGNLERLNELYPEHEMLTIQETMQVMGYKSKNTAKKYIPFTNSRVSKATLARIMCG